MNYHIGNSTQLIYCPLQSKKVVSSIPGNVIYFLQWRSLCALSLTPSPYIRRHSPPSIYFYFNIAEQHSIWRTLCFRKCEWNNVQGLSRAGWMPKLQVRGVGFNTQPQLIFFQTSDSFKHVDTDTYTKTPKGEIKYIQFFKRRTIRIKIPRHKRRKELAIHTIAVAMSFS